MRNHEGSIQKPAHRKLRRFLFDFFSFMNKKHSVYMRRTMGKGEKEKEMKKRIVSVILTLGMTLGLLCGCGQNGGSQTEQTETQTAKEQNYEPVVYDYEQDLNVIDDNYRNYYEIFVYSFYDSDGDGIGDFNGVIDKLDYIQDMGFNGIWLMPVLQSPTYHKYDVEDYCKVDESYGTNEDFEKLIEECHKRGIRVVMDFEMNHTSSQHEWFRQACEYLKTLSDGQQPDAAQCPYVDYYHFSDKKENDNYYQVAGTNWYYEGSFWSEMPDLNFANENVKKEFEDIAAFWIGKGVDGFRLDAIMHLEENKTTFNTEIMNWYYEYCKSLDPDFYMVSEVWADEMTIADYYQSGTPSMFNFDAGNTDGALIKTAQGGMKADTLVNRMLKYQTDFSAENPDYIDAPFLTNHDMARVSNVLQDDEDEMKFAAGLLMTMSGSPFVYYGEEIGMASSGQKDENKRLPMIWSDTDKTGMTSGPEDADPDITSEFPGVDEQEKDPLSLLNYYKRAIRIRNENPEIARGQITKIDELCGDTQAAITKTYQDSTIGIVYNTSDEAASIAIGDSALKDMQIRGYLTVDGSVITLEDGTLEMPARSICILK